MSINVLEIEFTIKTSIKWQHKRTYIGMWNVVDILPRKYDVRFVFTPICFEGRGGAVVFYLCYLYSHTMYLCPTWFPYQMMFVSFNSSMTGATSGAGIVYHSRAPHFIPGFLWDSCVVQSFLSSVLCITICRFVFFSLSHCIDCPSLSHCIDYPSLSHYIDCPSLSHCIDCPSIYVFWLSLWYFKFVLLQFTIKHVWSLKDRNYRPNVLSIQIY